MQFCGALNSNELVNVEGSTNLEGKFTAEGYSDGSFAGHISKDGYYKGSLNIPQLVDIIDRKWQPWDATGTTVLRLIGSPVALHAKTVYWAHIPEVGNPCGYDLLKGDWVVPHGKGSVADLVFLLERQYVDYRNFAVAVTVRFSNSLDGIQETDLPSFWQNGVFKWPREAPEAGYKPELKSSHTRDQGKGATITAKDDQAYFFRVRTVERDGQIISALYGKIRGGVELAPSDSKTSMVKLTYYINPTPNDRNLEWDTTKNLIPDLKREETPREP